MKTTAKNSRKSANSKRTNGWKKGKVETKASPTDVYEKFTNLILDKLKQGIIPWNQPWNPKGMPSNYLSKKPYIHYFFVDVKVDRKTPTNR